MSRRQRAGRIVNVWANVWRIGCLAAWALIQTSFADAQELEPRSYSPSPVGANFIIAGYGHSEGEIVFDASAPISDASADLNVVSVGYSKVFDLGGRQASIAVGLPYFWGEATGNIGEASQTITRSGPGDMRVKFSTLLMGGPALSRKEFAERKPGPVIGISLLALVPTGEYMPDKLINIGGNRWALKPEIGISYPMGRWQADAYAGVWIYSDNDEFRGNLTSEREPLGAFQAHVSYTFRPGLWAALNATYYTGGATTIEDTLQADRQENARIGATLSAPVTRSQSLLFSFSDGAFARSGGDFTSFAVTWRTLWFDGP